MRNPNDWFDLARARAGICSDYALAQRLGVTRQTISALRARDQGLSETLCEKLAPLCGVEPGIIYAEAQASRAKRTEVREFWSRVARGLAAVLLVGVVGVFVGGVVQVAEARALSPAMYYAHLARGRRWWRTRARWPPVRALSRWRSVLKGAGTVPLHGTWPRPVPVP